MQMILQTAICTNVHGGLTLIVANVDTISYKLGWLMSLGMVGFVIGWLDQQVMKMSGIITWALEFITLIDHIDPSLSSSFNLS